jgi:hypothetical protein
VDGGFATMSKTSAFQVSGVFFLPWTRRFVPDSGTSVFFVIYDEPFLVCLDALQCCLVVGSIREASWGPMDDVNIHSEDEKDIIVADEVCRAFEGASGTFLNMNPRLSSSAWAPGRVTKSGLFCGCRRPNSPECMELW